MPEQDHHKKNQQGIFYHIYNKGIDARNLFNDQKDYEVFISFLKDYLTSPADPESTKKTFTVNGRTFKGIPHQPKNYFGKVELLAYGLMPDHFHLLLYQKHDGSLEKLIRSLCTRYAIYYNKKYSRSGSLLQGPYKSAQIKNPSHLLYLTHYFHQTSSENGEKSFQGYSSYPEYLGQRESSWVNTKVVMDFFSQAENETFKGVGGYKNFVEKYELNENEKSVLTKLMLEDSFDRYNKVSTTEERPATIVLPENVHPTPSRQSTVKFMATALGIFVMLFGIGFRNIKVSTAQTDEVILTDQSPASQVSGVKDEVTNNSQPDTSDTEQDSLQAKNPTTSEPIKKIIIIIPDGDESESVNIRKEPSTKSEKVASANEGDIFELVSEGGQWYKIKLGDGSEAFVSVRYAKLEGEE